MNDNEGDNNNDMVQLQTTCLVDEMWTLLHLIIVIVKQNFFYLMMLFQWINLLGGHTLIYMTTYDNEVDLDDTYENVQWT